MFDKYFNLQNDFVVLRSMMQEDYSAFKHLTSNKDMWTYFTSDLSVEKKLQIWVDDAVAQMQKKVRHPFTIETKPDKIIIGSSSFGNISHHDHRLEIGYTWITDKYQGKGYNNHIKLLMLEYAFETLKFERVEFKTDVLNIPARKALSRIGAIEEGILRSHTLMSHNRRRDTIYYSILRSEWPSVKSHLKSLLK